MACSRAPEPRTSILTGSGYPAHTVMRTSAATRRHGAARETADWRHGTRKNR